MRYFVIFFVVLFSFVNLLTLEIPYSTKAVKTDSNLLSGFYRADIEDGSMPPNSTKAWIWRSNKYLHISWEVAIDSNFTKGEFTPKDNIPNSDFLRVQIITTPSDPFSYGFYAFPLGNKYDNTKSEDMNIDSDWDSSYKYSTSYTDNSWLVEMQIPFRDLRFSGSAPYSWNIILSRYYEENESLYSLPDLSDTSGKEYFRQALPIEIAQAINRDKIISLKPYVIGNFDIIDKELDDLSSDNVGLDITLKPFSTSKIKVSINPDFSDVPLDSAIDTSNLKYAPTFSENRYFFNEDYNAFGVGTGLFYSRNILQPKYGLKGTYKSNKLSVAFLLTEDKKTTEDGATLNHNDIFHLSSVRYQTSKFNIQGTFLSRKSDDWYNKVYHFRPSWEFKQNWIVYADLNYSRYINTLEEKYTDNGYYAKLGFDLSRNNFYFNSYINKMSKDFTAEMGNINEKDSYSYLLVANQSFPIDKKLVKSLSTNIFSESKWKNNDDIMYRNLRWKNSITFQNKLNLSFNALLEQEKPDETIHNVDYLETIINYRKHRTFAPFYTLRYAHAIHYGRDEVYPYLFQRLGFYSSITSHIMLSCYLDYSQYLDFKENRSIISEYFEEDELIAKYETYIWENAKPLTSNVDLSLNLNNNITLKMGYRFLGASYKYQVLDLLNTTILDEGEKSSQAGIYSNLTLILHKRLNIYLGYNSFNSSPTEYLSQNEKDYNNLYLKLSYSY